MPVNIKFRSSRLRDTTAAHNDRSKRNLLPYLVTLRNEEKCGYKYSMSRSGPENYDQVYMTQTPLLVSHTITSRYNVSRQSPRCRPQFKFNLNSVIYRLSFSNLQVRPDQSRCHQNWIFSNISVADRSDLRTTISCFHDDGTGITINNGRHPLLWGALSTWAILGGRLELKED